MLVGWMAVLRDSGLRRNGPSADSDVAATDGWRQGRLNGTGRAKAHVNQATQMPQWRRLGPDLRIAEVESGASRTRGGPLASGSGPSLRASECARGGAAAASGPQGLGVACASAVLVC
jgi:hypothetical protein